MMNFSKPLLSLLFFVLLSSTIFSQKIWKEISKVEYNNDESEVYEKKNFPSAYKLMSLDVNFIDARLSRKSSKSTDIIELPDANGNLKKFIIQETSNFESELQQKFPDIKSFTAKGIEDPTAIAKISIGTDGFHGTIFSGNHSTLYIDPYSKDKKDYIIYSRKDLPKNEQDFKCLVEENVKSNNSELNFNKVVNDGKLRTFRLAIVCSGEYAQFHLNRQNVSATATDSTKKAAVLSAMNTSMTRINGVFEKDLGVKMVIVNNNENIIFLDAATDNISDGNANTMIDQVQSICDSQIGNANYDVGHIFSIGGAGLAGLGVVCINGQKARGVTGIGAPVNDPYDIDYVAHELGHQFGATHTFNNFCQNNRTNSTAVEPGSGSTVMGYAGICSPNVLGVGNATGNSDDYFHAVSIAQMQAIINSSGDCASLSDTNNATPTANAGIDYSIPKSTPFKLTGSATDADGLNSLTYNWEQIDTEIATMPPSSTNNGGPMFRSLPSKTVPVRYFPELATVVGGSTSSQWEVIPDVARDLNFAFTVRDNNVGGGSTARDDMKVTVTNANAFTVSSQNTSTTWDTGSTETITWNVGTTNIAPISCNTVNIRLSVDGGITFPILLKSNTPNDGTENIVIPDNATSNARIMVEAADNIFYNVNSANIVINSTTPTFLLNSSITNQSACNSGNESITYTLDVNFVNSFSENVTLSATGNPQGSQVSFNPSTINSDGNVVMTVSNFDGLTPQNYSINVLGTSTSLTQNIDLGFQLTSTSFGNLTLSSPTNNATDVSLIANLSWAADANATSYDVEVATDNTFSNIVSSTNTTLNSFSTPVLTSTTTYFWRVRSKNSCATGNYSSVFSFTTEDCQICQSFGDTQYNTSTTLVSFNTINNASTKNDSNNVRQGYFDYTAISTNVKREDSHNLTVQVNTDGPYRVQVKVWIDWNGDCAFNDTDEEYDLGFAANVADGITDQSPFSITIPKDAKLGNTVMRVSSRYTDSSPVTYPTSCQESFDGEVEDYTLVIEDATASLEDVSFSKFNLFPNPNSGEFTLMFETIDTAKTTLELFDVRGRRVGKKVFKNTNTLFREEIQFGDLSKGIYLLKINNGDKQTTRKLIID